MYSIYIRHFIAPESWPNHGTVVEEEYKMYDLPAEYPESEILTDPSVKNEMGKAGSFDFSMEMENPWYGSLCQMTTLMRVEYDEDTIFYGRVLNIDTDMWGKKKVHCEGALAFLLDTLIIPTKESEREKISLEKHIHNIIDTHNSLVRDEPNKQFSYGQVPGSYTEDIPSYMRPVGEDRKYGAGSWTSTMNCLEDLTSKFGGYWRARYEKSDGKLYLDWLLNMFYPQTVGQKMKITENIIDLQNSIDVNGIFTVFIPEGSKGGNSVYLDDIPKTIVKTPNQKEPKEPIGPSKPTGSPSPGSEVYD